MSRNKSSFHWSPPKVNKNNDIWHSLISKYASRTEVAANRNKSGNKRKYHLLCKTSR